MADLIYKRYGGNTDSIFSMPFLDGYELINYALEAEYEEKIFLRWAIGYQFTMRFEEFKRNIRETTRCAADNRTAAEILAEVRNIVG